MDSPESSAAQTAPTRSWYRLHAATWLAAVSVAAALIAQNVLVTDTFKHPVVLRYFEPGLYYPRYLELWEYAVTDRGWPLPYARDVKSLSSRYDSLRNSPWPRHNFPSGEITDRWTLSLAFNIAFGVVLVLAALLAVEYRCRNSLRLLPWGWRGWLLLVVCAGLFFGAAQLQLLDYWLLLYLPIGLGFYGLVFLAGLLLQRRASQADGRLTQLRKQSVTPQQQAAADRYFQDLDDDAAIEDQSNPPPSADSATGET